MSTLSHPRPSSFFKYRPWLPQPQRQQDGSFTAVNYTEALLREARFYCQGPRDFDDPHDSHTGVVPTGSEHDIDRFVMEDMAPVVGAMRRSRLTSLTQLGTVQTPEANAALRHRAGRTARRNYRILCLSASCDSELMWSFYADYHRGICLEFDGAEPCFDGVAEVRYAEQPPALGCDDARPLHADALEKSLAWRHQEEWRLLSSAEYRSFPPSALKRVILGYRFPENAFDSLTQALVDKSYRVEIAQMQRQPSSYHFTPVTRGAVAPTS
jgi:hypothetical protein